LESIFLSLFQLSVIALVLKVFFLLPLQELPAVALQRLEKITFKTAGLPLQFGAVGELFVCALFLN
jgi:hypothetical protein